MRCKRHLILLVFLISTSVAGQDAISDFSSSTIKSVHFSKSGFPLSYPVLEMGEESPLLLTFDDLSTDLSDYYYSVTLCNVDWSVSRLAHSEYSPGLISYPASNYSSSSNTLVHYNHYEIEIPNNDLQLNLSGNYVIKVFANNDSDNPVLVRRFVLVEKRVEIDAKLKIPVLPEYRKNSQQLDFTIFHQEFPISNPHQELKVIITQNFDWNTALKDLKPQFIKPGSLEYNYTKENLFIAGNEFRSFNINSRKYPSPEVLSFDYNSKNYVATLATDKDRSVYFLKEDINGQFINENKDVRNAENAIESDYFQVNFSLSTNLLPYDGEIYLNGGLTGFALNEESKMKYNFDKNIYENSLFLKQGYYDYKYIFIPKEKGAYETTEIEGSFSETENNYFIFVYHRGFGDRYDKVIGYKRVAIRE